MAVLLVADDEPAIGSLISLVLRSGGHAVVTARNGLEAIILYRAAPNRYDLVITDLDMPIMDGFQLIRLILETKSSARILCMSGNADREMPAGIPFLPKPFTPDALRTCVTGLLC